MSRDIAQAHPILREFWPKLRDWYQTQHPGRSLFLTHVDRKPSEQLALFCQGRLPDKPGAIVTYKDGYNKQSKHNLTPSHAFDVGVLDKGAVVWPDEYFEDLGMAINELGFFYQVTWGGSWQMRDLCHFEINESVH